MRTILLPCLLLSGALLLPSCSGGREVPQAKAVPQQESPPKQEPARTASPMMPVSTGSALRDGLADPVWEDTQAELPGDARGGLRTPGLPAVLPMTLDGKINTDT